MVELAGGVAGAFCGRMLQGFGAERIRVEHVAGLDGVSDTLSDDQRVFLVAGARRLALAGGSDLDDLLDGADVIVDDHGPDLLERLGLAPGTPGTTRPDRIVTSISPFGLDGPRSHWRAGNAVQFATGGILGLTGESHRPPLITGGDQALFLGGLQGFAATTVALLGRARSGRGGLVEISMQEAAASMLELYGPMSEYETGEPVARAGNSVRAVWGVYRCVDGFAGVCCLERQTRALFSLIGPEVVDDPRFADAVTRAEHDDELLAHVLMFMLDRTKDELLALSPVHRVPFGAVRTPAELLDDEGFALRGFLDRIETGAGTAVVPGRPFPGLGWNAPGRLDPAPTGPDPVPPRTAARWPSALPAATTAEPSPDSATSRSVGPGSSGSATSRSVGPASPERAAAGEPPAPGTVAPLDGVRVVDLTMMWAGPYATKLLAECGADVIKVESPRAWDNIRTLVPQDPDIPDPWNSAYYFNEYNHSKRSLTLDLATAAGREVLLRLVATADVVIENYRADVLDNLGLGYDVLRAARDDIVVVSMAGFGKTGPLTHHVGFGPIIEMMSGLMSLTGYGDDDVPYKTGISYGDPVGGLNAVAAVALALAERDRTGRGRHIDLSQRETAATLAGPAFVAASLRGEDPVHRGNRHPDLAPQGCYPSAGEDRWLALTVGDDAEWDRVADLIGRPDLAGLTTPERRDRHDELDAVLATWTGERTATAAAEALQALGVAAAEVNDTVAIHDDPQLVARGFWCTVPNPKMRPYRQSGPTWTLHGARPHLMVRSPWFGEHNDGLLTELGLSTAEIGALASDGVIAAAPVDPGVG